MKKLSLLSIALLVPIMSFANSDEVSQSEDMMCIQVIQSAMNANGECKEFSTPCDVPADWKKVSSCENFAEKEHTSDIGDATDRRHKSKWAVLRAKAAASSVEKSETTTRNYRSLRSSRRYTKRNTNEETSNESTLSRKSSTIKNWASSFRKLVTPARQKAIDAKEEVLEKRKEAKLANRLRKRVGTATSVKRDGKLSKSYFSLEANDRRNKSTTTSEAIQNGLKSRQPFRKAQKKRVSTTRTATLRRIYRGTSHGSLDPNSTEESNATE